MLPPVLSTFRPSPRTELPRRNGEPPATALGPDAAAPPLLPPLRPHATLWAQLPWPLAPAVHAGLRTLVWAVCSCAATAQVAAALVWEAAALPWRLLAAAGMRRRARQ